MGTKGKSVGGLQAIQSKIKTAEEFAQERHKGQLRKDCITPYTEHLKRVVANAKVLGVNDEDILCACWLHDTIEDTATDFDDIAEKFGVEVAEIVVDVTKDKRLPRELREKKYAEQLGRANWKAQVVKFCDIWANIADLKSGYPEIEDRMRQVENKLHYFVAIKDGLGQFKLNIPKLQKGIDDLNILLAEYGSKLRTIARPGGEYYA